LEADKEALRKCRIAEPGISAGASYGPWDEARAKSDCRRTMAVYGLRKYLRAPVSAPNNRHPIKKLKLPEPTTLNPISESRDTHYVERLLWRRKGQGLSM